MATITFDTYKHVNRLKEAGLSEQQAAEVVSVVSEAHDTAELVTKNDLAAALSEAKAEIIKWVVGLIFMQTGVIVALMLRLAK